MAPLVKGPPHAHESQPQGWEFHQTMNTPPSYRICWIQALIGLSVLIESSCDITIDAGDAGIDLPTVELRITGTVWSGVDSSAIRAENVRLWEVCYSCSTDELANVDTASDGSFRISASTRTCNEDLLRLSIGAQGYLAMKFTNQVWDDSVGAYHRVDSNQFVKCREEEQVFDVYLSPSGASLYESLLPGEETPVR